MHESTDSKRVQDSPSLVSVVSQMPPTTEDGEIPEAAEVAADSFREKGKGKEEERQEVIVPPDNQDWENHSDNFLKQSNSFEIKMKKWK